MRRRKFFCLVLVLAVGGRAALAAPPAAVLLAAATDAELQPLLARLADPHAETRAAWQFWTGSIDGRAVVLARTEGDPLNAVAATAVAIRAFAPALVVTLGSARALDPALRPGDVVISEKFAAMDGMVSPPTGPGGGSHPLQWRLLPHLAMTAGEGETPAESFPADARARALLQHLAPPRGRVVAGVLGSSGQVNREADRVAWLRQKWGASCEDGESADIAGCASLLGVPVVGLRVIDATDGEAAGLALQFLEAWK